MFRVDRQDFIDCYNGDLMIRNSKGVITHLGDRASDAVDAAERGETVELLVRGKLFSKFINGREVIEA
jgi:hypothetical protein